jgi:uncharacterized DUF497 family protein
MRYATASDASNRVRRSRSPGARYEDASPAEEERQACIGLTGEYRLLYVVHVIREEDVLRLISARLAELAERRRYEDE